jgi:hypothetical protein
MQIVRVACLILGLALLMMMGACGGEGETPAQTQAREAIAARNAADAAQQKRVEDATKVIKSMVYMRDPRKGNLCFAYLWEGNAHGGPALTWLPCSEVPPSLLITADIPPLDE